MLAASPTQLTTVPEVVPDVEECKEEGAKNGMQVKQSIAFGYTMFLQIVSQPGHPKIKMSQENLSLGRQGSFGGWNISETHKLHMQARNIGNVGY